MPKKNSYLESADEYAKHSLQFAMGLRSMAADPKFKGAMSDPRKKTKETFITMLAFYRTGMEIANNKLNEKDAGDYYDKMKEELENSPQFNNLFDSCTPDELVSLVGKPKLENQKNWEVEWEPASPEQVETRIAGTEREMAANKPRLTELVEKLEQSTQKSFTGKLKSFFVGNSKEYETALKAMKGLRDGTISNEQAKKDITTYLNLRGKKVRNHQYGRDRFDALMGGLSTIMKPKEFIAYCGEIDKARHERDKGYHVETNPDRFKSPEQAKKDTALRYDMSALEKDMKDPKTRREEDHSTLYQLLQYGIRKQFGTMKNGEVDKTMGNTLYPYKKEEMEHYLHVHPSARATAKQIVDQFGLDIKVPPVREVPAELKQTWELGGDPEMRPGGKKDKVMINAARKAQERDNGGPQLQ